MDRLQRALEIYLEWSTAAKPAPEADFLERHADLRDLLELMLQDRALVDKETKDRQKKIGEFDITREIGRGGMGVVYEARQNSLDRKVALKVLPAHLTLHPAAVARFKREALTAAKLEHPSVVKVFAVGSEGDTHYFAMELIEGSSLDRLIERDREALVGERTPLERKVAMIIDVADALAFAHEGGVVHRDVKPSNILVRQDGSTVLTDFGLAREDALPSMTTSGTFAGTPYYVAPEQALGNQSDIDARTDVFSLGVTLYEFVTLHRPFDGENSREVLEKILGKDPPDPRKFVPDLPEDLVAILTRALEKESEQRYASMHAFASDLRAFRAGRPVSARKVTKVERARRWLRREPKLAGMGIAIIAVLVISLAISLSLLYRLDRTQKQASEEAASKGRLLAEVQRLADVQRLEDLALEEDKLWPPHQKMVESMEAWVASATRLEARRGLHEGSLSQLEKDARTDADSRWQLAMERQVVQRMQDLASKKALVERRITFARNLEAKSFTEPEARAAWDLAREVIRSSPVYGGLDLAPQLGLLPLGKDPKSGLYEFWHMQTGKAPLRDEDGAVRGAEATGIVLVLVPGGRAVSGSQAPDSDHPQGTPYVDPLREPNEAMRSTDLPPFFLGKHEVTQAQFRHVCTTNPSFLKPGRWGDHRSTLATNLRYPVECVTWEEAERFCFRTGLLLPNEAQWEHAARAGTTTVYWTGDDPKTLSMRENLRDRTRLEVLGVLGAEPTSIEDGFVLNAPVGALEPNPFGLFDMLGNVAEWCGNTFVVNQNPNDSRPATRGDQVVHVIRGGSYDTHWRSARCAGRYLIRGETRSGTIGFRVARAIES